MAESKKAMDVSKPGEAKPDIGSKPMIVGHRSMVDPMVSEKKPIEDLEAGTELPVRDPAETAMPSVTKKTIEPISAPEEPEAANKEEAAEADESKPEEKIVEEEKAVAIVPDSDKQPEDSSKEKEKKPEKIDPVAVAMEREEKVKKLIESKKYFVNIKQASGSSKNLLWVLVLILLLGLATVFVLIDTGKLDPGFKLPFSLFGTEETKKPNPISTTVVPTQPTTEDEEMAEIPEPDFTTEDWFTYKTPGYSMKIPDGWVLQEKEGGNGSLFSAGELRFKEGTLGRVEKYKADYPIEGIFTFVLDYLKPDKPVSCEFSGNIEEFKTHSGIDVVVTTNYGTIPASQRSLGDLAEGEVQYEYCFATTGVMVLATYLASEDQENDRQVIESALKTFEFK